jgi:hypothetical protein
MKVTGSSGPTPTAAGASAKPAAAATGFTLGGSASAAPAAAAARASGLAGVASTEALLAMQAVEGPLERRRRAVKRAGRLLDALDEVKKAMLGVGGEGQALQRLAQAVREQRDPFGDDAKLSGVLDEIETRAAVELAKAEMSRLAA